MASYVHRRADAQRRRHDPSLPRRPLTLVVDASVLVAAALGERGAAELPHDDLIAPPLGWSEATSVLHETAWRGERGRDVVREALRRLDDLPVVARSPRGLRAEAWRIADELGWAKTYDAEYLALARINGCRVVTLDARLLRGTARLGLVIGWGRR